MSEGKKRESPLALDMDFGEALRRFANVSSAELDKEMGTTGKPKRKAANVGLSWTKELSKTDAQQKTKGAFVEFLRLTQKGLSEGDFKTWFRTTMFGDCDWHPGKVGRDEDAEICHADIMYMINGVKLGTMVTTISHSAERYKNNSAPNTWLHWPDAIKSVLHENDTTGWPVTLTRTSDGSFNVDIQAASSED